RRRRCRPPPECASAPARAPDSAPAGYLPWQSSRFYRQPDHEFTAAAGAFARGMDAAAVHLGQPARERQPDPEAAREALTGAFGLREHLEDSRQRRRLDADAVIAHRDHRLGAVALQREADATAARRVAR